MKVESVDPASPLFGYVRPGHRLISINGHRIADSLDFQYRMSDEHVRLRFADDQGRTSDLHIDDPTAAWTGITLEHDPVSVCNCNCVFCFVRQQPRGLRPTLYIKDEDFRLSFLYGNYLTLSRLTERDIRRIFSQRLSPLYVSVHTTDDPLRRRMLGNSKLKPIVPLMRRLIRGHITLHTQIVLCPDINDHDHLKKTITDLAGLHPGVASIAVVPVGLTKYRKHLPYIRPFNRTLAAQTLDLIETCQRGFLKTLGTRLVWAADELYLKAGLDLPGRSTYEEVPQFENGVGMAREFITNFNRKRRSLKKLSARRRALFLTGYSAYPMWTDHIIPYVRPVLGSSLTVTPVRNHFWGHSVTVSGLLVGHDLLRAARKTSGDFDLVVLPPNCLNRDALFLDDLSLAQFEERLGKPAIVGDYDLLKTLTRAFS